MVAPRSTGVDVVLLDENAVNATQGQVAGQCSPCNAPADDQDLGLDKKDSAIALGHPVGCSGAFITTKALYELQRINGKYALMTMCIGGGQGIAVIFERLYLTFDDQGRRR